jgi:hypothetical protein
MRHTIRLVLIATTVAAGSVLVSGCGDQIPATGATAAAGQSRPAASPSEDASLGPVKAPAEIEHVHNLSLVGKDLLLGTHEGLFRQSPGEPPKRVSEPFDVMGFTIDGSRWLASGHPGPGMSAPADLGLLLSDDQGRTWDTASLSGQVDFHRLTSSGEVVLGINSGDGLLWRSSDEGASWDTLDVSLYDVALDPGDPDIAVATTERGPLRSEDGGRTWSAIKGAPLIALLSWHDGGLVAVTPDGQITTSTDGGRTWTQGDTLKEAPLALTASDDDVAVLAGDTVWFSSDAGMSFQPRVTGLGGH